MSDGGLLKWAAYYTRGHDHIKPVNDLTKCWADGLSWCALLYNWFPEQIPITELKTETDEDKIFNCELAFKVAEEAGITKYLDGEDMVYVQDRKSIILYLSEIYSVLKDTPPKFTPSDDWQRNYEQKMIMEKRAVMEANAADRIGGSPMRDTPKGQSVAVSRGIKVTGGLTPAGSLWANRLGGNTTPLNNSGLSQSTEADPSETSSPRTKEDVKKNLGKEIDNEAKKPAAEDKKPEDKPEGGPTPATRSATSVPKKGTGSLWANRTGATPAKTDDAPAKKEEGKSPATRSATINTATPVKDKEPEKPAATPTQTKPAATSSNPQTNEAEAKKAAASTPSAKPTTEPEKPKPEPEKKVPAKEPEKPKPEPEKKVPAKEPEKPKPEPEKKVPAKEPEKPKPEPAQKAPEPEKKVEPTQKTEPKGEAPNPYLLTDVSGAIAFNIGGRGKTGGVSGSTIIVSVTVTVNGEPEEVTKNDLEVYFECPGPEIKPNIMLTPGKAGVYHVGFNAKEPGQYWLDFVFKGKWASTPFFLPVKTATGAMPEHPYEGKKRKESGGAPAANPPEKSTAKPETKSEAVKEPEKPKPEPEKKVPAKEPEKPKPEPEKKVPAKEPEKPKPEPAQKAPAKEPEKPKEKAPVAPQLCTAVGPGLESITDLDTGKFQVTIRDEDNQIIPDFKELEVTITPNKKISVTKNKDGSFSCSYEPLDEGKYQIAVKVQGKHIKNSPFSIVVTEGVASAEFSSISVYIQVINKKGEIVVPRAGESISLFNVECKGGSASQIQDSGLEDGRYHFEYKGTKGANTLNVVSITTGKSIDGFPFTVTV